MEEFDFGGDFDFGGEAGVDPFADQFGQDEDPMGFGEMTEEEAREAIADAIAEEEAMTGEFSSLREELQDADMMAGQGQSVEPTDVEPVDLPDSEVSPNERVDDAFFDQGGQPTIDTPYPGGMTQEMLRGAFRESDAFQQQLQNLGASRPGLEQGPLPPQAPSTGQPQIAQQSTPSFSDRFRDSGMTRQDMETLAPLQQLPSQQAVDVAQAMSRSRADSPDAIMPSDMVPMPYPRPGATPTTGRVAEGFRALEQGNDPARNYPALAVLSGMTPAPASGDFGPEPESLPALEAIRQALSGQTPSGTPNVPAFTEEPIDPNALPAVEGPIPGAETLPEQVVTAPRPSETGAPGEGEVLGPGPQSATDPSTRPGESPETREERRQEQVREIRRRREQQQAAGGQPPPTGGGGRPSGGVDQHPITSVPAPPQSVLRTDIRPEEQRVREDVQRVLEGREAPVGPRVVRPPQLPGVTAGQVAREVVPAVAGAAYNAAAKQAADLGNVIPTVFGAQLDPGGGLTSQQQIDAMFAIPNLVGAVAINPIMRGASAAAPAFVRSLAHPTTQRVLGGIDVTTGVGASDVAAASAPLLKQAGAGAANAISANELMGTFSSLAGQVNPISPVFAQGRLSGAQREQRTRMENAFKKGFVYNPESHQYDKPSTGYEEMTSQGLIYEPWTGTTHAMQPPAGYVPPTLPGDSPTPKELAPRHEIPSEGGRTTMLNDEYWLLGAPAGVTLGMLLGPRLGKFLRHTALPAIRSIAGQDPYPRYAGELMRDVPAGTRKYSQPIDIVHAAHDPAAAASNVLKRMGASKPEWEAAQAAMHHQTRGAAKARAAAAIETGHMKSNNWDFDVKRPLSQLLHKDTRESGFSEYIQALDTLEEIKLAAKKLGPNVPPPTIRDETWATARQTVNDLRRANPHFLEWDLTYRENLKELRRIQSTGESALITKEEATMLNKYRPHEVVQWHRRQTGDAFEQGSVSTNLARHMEATLVKQMEMDVQVPYVDMARRYRPDSFNARMNETEFRQHIAKNPRHEYGGDSNDPHTRFIRLTRRGVPEYHFADPATIAFIKSDPYAITGSIESALYTTNRVAQASLTGPFAPWFAEVGLWRNHMLATTSVPPGAKAPWIPQTLAAIPQQLGPQAALGLSRIIESSPPNGWWTNLLGPQGTQNVSKWLSKTYSDSVWAQLQKEGGNVSNLMASSAESLNLFGGKLSRAGGARFHNETILSGLGPTANKGGLAARYMGDMWMATLEAHHNAAGYATSRRNLATHGAKEAALMGRQVSGDVRVQGMYYQGSTGKGIPYESMEDPALDIWAAKAVGAASHWGRVGSMFFNPTVQGMKAVGKAWIDDPDAFTARVWLYGVMPGIASYLLSRGMGKDQNGVEYSDYNLHGRSNYSRMMHLYIPPFWNPGAPAESGHNHPMIFHEGAIGFRMGQIWMDHLIRSKIFPEREAMMAAANNLLGGWSPETVPRFVTNMLARDERPTKMPLGVDVSNAYSDWMGIVADPANPALLNAYMGAIHGQRGAQGVFSESYRQRVEKYDPQSPFPPNLELLARAMAPGIADIIGAGAYGYSRTKEDALTGVKNFGIEAGRKFISRFPTGSTVTGIKPPMSGTTDTSNEMFKKSRVVNDILRHANLSSDSRDITAQSVMGGNIVEERLGPDHPMVTRPRTHPVEGRRDIAKTPTMGLPRPAATNPLYIENLGELRQHFSHDSYGYKTLWRRRGMVTKDLNELKKVNSANAHEWATYMESDPERLAWLQRYNIDHTSPVQVTNFMMRQRRDIDNQLLMSLQEVEDKMTIKARQKNPMARRVRIEDLAPYGDPTAQTDEQLEAMWDNAE